MQSVNTPDKRYKLALPVTLLAALMAAALIAAFSPPTIQAAHPQKAAVTGLTIADGDNAGEVNVSWDAHPEDAEEYRLAWAPDDESFRRKSDSDWNAFPSGNSHTITGLDEAEAYRFKVRARFESGPSSNWSRVVTFTTTETANAQEPPAQVRSAQAVQRSNETQVRVSWSDSEGATKYQVERNTDPPTANDPVVTDITDTSTSHVDSDTSYDTSYRYRVRAGNDAGYGTWSETARITTDREPGTPAAPGSFTATEDDPGTVQASWSAPTGPEDVGGYRLYRRHIASGTESLLASLGASATSHDDSTVAAETIYTYWVRAHNSTGASPKSRLETVTTQVQSPRVPETPTGVAVTEDTPGEVVVSWQRPAEGPAITGYNVYRQRIGDSEIQLLKTADAADRSYTDDTVEAEKWYSYHLRAVNDHGESTASRSRVIKTEVQTPGVPKAPTGLKATEDTAGVVALTWKAPATGPELTGYKIYRKTLTGPDTLLGTTGTDTTTFTDDTVAAETWYDYRVRANNDAGHGSESGLELIRTQAQTEGAPPAPEDTEADQ